MGLGEFIFKVLLYSVLGGIFLNSSAKAMDEKQYSGYGINMMLSIPFIVSLVITCVEFIN